MASLEAYEVNLHHRLKELKEGDPVYQLHQQVVVDALLFSARLHRYGLPQSVLDCGLGFMTSNLKRLGWEIVGLDMFDYISCVELMGRKRALMLIFAFDL